MIIKILGGGCPKCKKLAQNAEEAADSLGLNYEIEKITDHNQYAQYGVMITPALVIDEKLVSAGKVLSVDKIKGFMSNQE